MEMPRLLVLPSRGTGVYCESPRGFLLLVPSAVEELNTEHLLSASREEIKQDQKNMEICFGRPHCWECHFSKGAALVLQ